MGLFDKIRERREDREFERQMDNIRENYWDLDYDDEDYDEDDD